MASFNSTSSTVGIVDDSGLGQESYLPIAKDLDDFISQTSQVVNNESLKINPSFTVTTTALDRKVTLLEHALSGLKLQRDQMQSVEALVDSHLTTENGEIDHLSMVRSPTTSEKSTLMDGDIKFSSFKPPAEKKSPIDYLDPGKASLKGDSERKALTALVLDEDSTLLTGYKAAKAAGELLLYPALKSHEIAKKVLQRQQPVSVNTQTTLGSGAFASVHPSSVGDTSCAAKKLHPRPSIKEDLASEYRSLAPFQHPNIIGLQLVDPANNTLHLELAEGGSLTSKLPGPAWKDSLSDLEFVTIAHQTSDALSHIHEQGFIHRDIKPDNVLLTAKNNAKISDFGTVTSTEKFNPKEIQGTVYYLPPEYLKGASTKENCQKIDVWSFGMLLWQQFKKADLVTPFVSSGNKDGSYERPEIFAYQLTKKFDGFKEGELEATLDTEDTEEFNSRVTYYDFHNTLVPLMKRCLAYNPEDRPSMEEIRAILAEEIKAVEADHADDNDPVIEPVPITEVIE